MKFLADTVEEERTLCKKKHETASYRIFDICRGLSGCDCTEYAGQRPVVIEFRSLKGIKGDIILPTGKNFAILIVLILVGMVMVDDGIARLIHWILLR
ncbi:hypothetical protein [Rahnella aquatilis]|uniref:hypothetical protein n=1 Tax=Rahnella aquatilis TaxID=34038 RepID=UPI00364E2E7B